MPPRKNYKRRSYSSRSSRAKPKKQRSPVLWLAAGMLVGASLMGLVWLKLDSGRQPVRQAVQPAARLPATAQPEPVQPLPAAEPAAPASDDQPEMTPPRFEYYSVLPEMEVVIPPEELGNGASARKPPPAPVESRSASEKKPESAPSPAPATTASSAPPGDGPIYLLQLGSFRRNDDAERLKASLGLLGITARIEKVTIDDRGTYYRVRSGPFSKEQVYSLHARLKESGVESQIIRVRS